MTERKPRVYVLRTCKTDMTSFGGFKWPSTGSVRAPDWDPSPKCGGGLHGLLWGKGDSSLLDAYGVGQIVEVMADRIVDLKGKVKFPHGRVIFTGTVTEARKRMDALSAEHHWEADLAAFVDYVERAVEAQDDRACAILRRRLPAMVSSMSGVLERFGDELGIAAA